MSKLDFHVSRHEIDSYFSTLAGFLTETAVTSASGAGLEMVDAVNRAWAHRKVGRRV